MEDLVASDDFQYHHAKQCLAVSRNRTLDKLAKLTQDPNLVPRKMQSPTRMRSGNGPNSGPNPASSTRNNSSGSASRPYDEQYLLQDGV